MTNDERRTLFIRRSSSVFRHYYEVSQMQHPRRNQHAASQTRAVWGTLQRVVCEFDAARD